MFAFTLSAFGNYGFSFVMLKLEMIKTTIALTVPSALKYLHRRSWSGAPCPQMTIWHVSVMMFWNFVS